jgi:hypothetical protein
MLSRFVRRVKEHSGSTTQRLAARPLPAPDTGNRGPPGRPEKILKIPFTDVRQDSQKPKTRPKSCIDMQQVYYFATTKKDGRAWMPVFG